MPWVHLVEPDSITDPLHPETLQLASEIIWQTFHQPEGDHKNVEEILVIVESFPGVAHAGSNKIHISAKYVANVNSDGRIEMMGVLYHETTHVGQWSGEALSGLMEGVVDYVRRKAWWALTRWLDRGVGERWDQDAYSDDL
ncbi:hypothetical protein Acr_06g0014910 [Actinidia rufa]|uniref:Plant basic secretory protein (BSP) family protein n=1 Tax=Actinidia rufa TaxID=165716 RepID=A0A7J0ESU9_9ERIC|nr:hypothetical protein Acr_06g0014910 [Actinidia rufa]